MKFKIQTDHLYWVIVALTNWRSRAVLICKDNVGNDMDGRKSSTEADCHEPPTVGIGITPVCSRSLASPNYLHVHVHGPQHRIVGFFLLRQWIHCCWVMVQLPSWP